MRLLGNSEDAAEITQEALLRTFWKVTQFHRRAHFYTWFYRIMLNLAYKRLAERSWEQTFLSRGEESDNSGSPLPVDPVSTELSPRDEAASHETITLVRRALARLKSSDFEVLILRDVEQLSYEALAHQLDIPEGTVMSRLHRARLAMARELANLGLDQ